MILAVDTSGPYISAALLQGGVIISDLHDDMAKGQAEALFPRLEQLLTRVGTGWRDIASIAVGTGPGNFTGIRISVSAMRGLALGLGVPVQGVSVLDALAHDEAGPVIASIAAPRGQAYVQGYRMTASLPPALVTIADLPRDLVQPGVVAAGSAGAEIAAHLGVPEASAPQSPACAIAHVAASRGQEAAQPAVPFYLKPADAAPSRDTPPVMLDDDA